jgi:beta-glucanase (GH16 family)
MKRAISKMHSQFEYYSASSIEYFKYNEMKINIMRIFLITIILFYCVNSEAQTWNLVWADEFDGTSIDKANWKYDTGGGGWGNVELQYYTDRPDNSTVKEGNLLIIAKKESYGGRSYTSARLKTLGLQSFTYGKFEGRMKFPKEQGIWPGFWMLGNNFPTVGWPGCGEIDIMEHVSLSPNINGTMHWQDLSGNHGSSGSSTYCKVSDYHTYGIEWDTKSVKWFLDGKKYYEVSILNNINGTDEMHLPFFYLLNLAVGGTWPGNPDATTTFPDTLYVDYVRVYQQGTSSNINNQIPVHFGLEQNYPNPFIQTTTFTYNLPSTSFVSLKVLDFTGKEVKSIVSEEMPAGNYSHEWNALGLPGGIYFCQLQAGSIIDTKKLVLLNR